MKEEKKVPVYCLTQKKINNYISRGGSHCPYCGSDDLQSGTKEADAGVVLDNVICQDVYTLTSIYTSDKQHASRTKETTWQMDIFGDLLNAANAALEYISNYDAGYIHEGVKTENGSCERDTCVLCDLLHAVQNADAVKSYIKNIQIYCHISGGNLQSVFSTDPNVVVNLIDDDNGNADACTATANTSLMAEVEAGKKNNMIHDVF